MSISVLTLRFDAHTDILIRLLWEVLAKEGIDAAALPRHRPHVTVSAHEVDDIGPLCAALPTFTRKISHFPIRFHAIGIFPETGTVFLGPHTTQQLLSLQADLLQFLSSHCGSPAYPEHLLPVNWIPHCTLATRLGRGRRASGSPHLSAPLDSARGHGRGDRDTRPSREVGSVRRHSRRAAVATSRPSRSVTTRRRLGEESLPRQSYSPIQRKNGS
jgi:hypothetical protein